MEGIHPLTFTRIGTPSHVGDIWPRIWGRFYDTASSSVDFIPMTTFVVWMDELWTKGLE